MSDIINPRDLDPSISVHSPFLGVYYNKNGQMVDMNSGEIITKDQLSPNVRNMSPFLGIYYDKDGNMRPVDSNGGGSTQDNPYVSLRDYGAVGDGVTDDTVAFQSAIDDAAVRGKILFINVGTYLITERLVIEHPLTIEGGKHDECIVLFKGEYHAETPYDYEWYEESNACFVVKPDNCTFRNFIIRSGDSKAQASKSNGIIFHWVKRVPPGETPTQYDAAQRFYMHQVNVEGFKNGVFIYAGWNRYFSCCHFQDNSEAGVKWFPLEQSTVGNWAASGDVIIACQFIGNEYGVYAAAAFETTVWNAVFEYNQRALYLDNSQDITFMNCWNEANYDRIYIRGSAKFIGGYNINSGTVEHVLIGGQDIVTFDAKTTNTVHSGGETVFIQQGGIITKGVNLSAEIDNLIANPFFTESSGGTGEIPSTLYWEQYPGWATSVSTDVRYNGHNSIYFDVTSADSDVGYGLWADDIPIDPTKRYAYNIQMMAPDRATIDEGVCLYITWRDGAHENILHDNHIVTLVGDNAWELASVNLSPPGGASYVRLGFGCIRNGQLYFAEPTFARTDSLVSNNVFVRQNIEDPDHLDIFDMSGVKLGKLAIITD